VDAPSAPVPNVAAADAVIEEVLPASAANQKRGAITISLAVRPDHPADVPFTTHTRKLRDFALDDDGDAVLPNSLTFTNVKPGAFTVQMGAAPDGLLTDIRCVSTGGIDNDVVDVAARNVTINVEASESVSCTFIDGWETGDLETATQLSWGDGGSSAGGLLSAHFSSVFGSSVEIGDTFLTAFTSALAVFNYLPAVGPASVR
jgi:hypothetical protein